MHYESTFSRTSYVKLPEGKSHTTFWSSGQAAANRFHRHPLARAGREAQRHHGAQASRCPWERLHGELGHQVQHMDAMGITWWISWDNMNISWDIPRFNGMQNGCLMAYSIHHQYDISILYMICRFVRRWDARQQKILIAKMRFKNV